MKGIPVTIGIVGHIDAKVTKEYKAQIENLLLDLVKSYPNSPIYLFSPLAEGADRFVAITFLELMKKQNLHDRFELIVPTPFEIDEYKNDFSADSKIEFDNLLAQAKRTFCVGMEDINDRPEQYLKTGKFIADSSLILIALWDGNEGEKGGTTDIVNYKRNGGDVCKIESIFEHDGSVFVLPCNRVNSTVNPNLNEKDLSLRIILQDSVIKQSLDKIEEINKDSLTLPTSILEESKVYLLDLSKEENESKRISESQTGIMNYYSILDTLSFFRFQKGNSRTIAWLFIFGFFFIVAFECYKHLWLDKLFMSKISLGATLLLVIIATIIFLFSIKNKFHKKHLYNRTLAEALRIQFFWSFADINENVADYILRIHKNEFTWIKHILSSIYGVTYDKNFINKEIIKKLKDNWIKNQADFFESKIAHKQKVLVRWKMIANTAFGSGFILLCSLFFSKQLYEPKQLHALIVVIGSLLALFAIIRGFIEIKGLKQILNQYELMNEIYQHAENKIEELLRMNEDSERQNKDIQELLFLVGKEALIENGNWYLIFKEKEPKVEGIG